MLIECAKVCTKTNEFANYCREFILVFLSFVIFCVTLCQFILSITET